MAPSAPGPPVVADRGAPRAWHTAVYLVVAVAVAASSVAQGWADPRRVGVLAILFPLAVVGILRRARQPWLLPLVGCAGALVGYGGLLGLGLFALALRRRDSVTVAFALLGAVVTTLGVALSDTPMAAPLTCPGPP